MCVIEHRHGMRSLQESCPVESLKSLKSPLHIGNRKAIVRRQARPSQTYPARGLTPAVFKITDFLFYSVSPATCRVVCGFSCRPVQQLAIFRDDREFNIRAAEINTD